jgi:23S rRNA (uridine2552-2'-O)-methyltransferase
MNRLKGIQRKYLLSNINISLGPALQLFTPKRIQIRQKSITSKQQWLQRVRKDSFIKQRNQFQYRSRSAFKLLELIDTFQLARPNSTILDLGCSPGGWSQVACKYGSVVGVDIEDMEPIRNVTFYHGDIMDPVLFQKLKPPFGLILSDMAHRFSGHSSIDVPRVLQLCEFAFQLCLRQNMLMKGGNFVCKFVEGSGVVDFEKELQAYFDKVVNFKPKACRSESKERYFVCIGFNPK